MTINSTFVRTGRRWPNCLASGVIRRTPLPEQPRNDDILIGNDHRQGRAEERQRDGRAAGKVAGNATVAR